jgi:SAM-dependent methyltransferase
MTGNIDPTRTESRELVAEFFDRQQATDQYGSLKRMTESLDRAAAEHLNREVCGKTLTIGGVWDHFEWRPHLTSLTVLDLSEEMLKVYCPPGATATVGDLYSCEFPPNSFDSVVFPLMLHHTPQGSWRQCEGRVQEAVRRARSWLKPGGRVYILEYCPHPAWNVLQRSLLPATRIFLARFRQPLVVMYTRTFYERVLEAAFGNCKAVRIAPDGFDYWMWYPVFMSIRWLKIPFVVYPKMHIFTATSPNVALA